MIGNERERAGIAGAGAPEDLPRAEELHVRARRSPRESRTWPSACSASIRALTNPALSALARAPSPSATASSTSPMHASTRARFEMSPIDPGARRCMSERVASAAAQLPARHSASASSARISIVETRRLVRLRRRRRTEDAPSRIDVVRFLQEHRHRPARLDQRRVPVVGSGGLLGAMEELAGTPLPSQAATKADAMSASAVSARSPACSASERASSACWSAPDRSPIAASAHASWVLIRLISPEGSPSCSRASDESWTARRASS